MRTNRLVALATIILMGSGCTPRGSISSDGSSSTSGSISISKVYPTSEGENWTAITASSRYYIKGLDVTITGTCTRGVSTVKVGESGVGGAYYTEKATCLNDGSFTWNKTYSGPLDADKTLTLVAFDVDDAAMTSATDVVQVHVDNVAPPAPTVTTPASSPFTYNGATSLYSIVGTIAGDAVNMTGPSGVTVTPSGANWTHDVTLTPGSSLDFTYYTYDLAGNQSTGTTQTIEWNPSISLLVAGVLPGAVVTDVGTSYIMEATVEPMVGSTTDGTSLFQLLTGLNFQANAAGH